MEKVGHMLAVSSIACMCSKVIIYKHKCWRNTSFPTFERSWSLNLTFAKSKWLLFQDGSKKIESLHKCEIGVMDLSVVQLWSLVFDCLRFKRCTNSNWAR